MISIMLLEGLLLAGLFLAVGYVLLFVDLRLSGAERLCYSFALSTLVFGVSLMPHYGRPVNASVLYFPLMVSLAAFLVFRKRLDFKVGWKILLIFLLSLLIKLALLPMALQPLSPDSVAHYLSSESFLSENWYTTPVLGNFWSPFEKFPVPVDYRPPLFNALVALSFALLGLGYPSAQLVSCIFGAAIIFPTYLIARELFGERAGLSSAVLIALNPFFVGRSLEAEPRTMIVYLLLTTFYFVLKGRSYWQYFALGAGLSYLTHPSSTWFLLAFALVYAVRDRSFFRRKETLFALVVFFVIISPWLVRNQLFFGSPLYSTIRYLPLMYGTEVYNSLTPPTLESYLSHYGSGLVAWAYVVGIRAVNVITSYFPPPHKVLDYGLAWFLEYPLFGTVSPLVFAAGFLMLLRLLRRGESTLPVVIVFTSLTAPLVVGFPSSNSVSVSSLSPLIPLYTILAAAWISERKKANALLFILLISVVLHGVFVLSSRPSAVIDAGVMDWIRENTRRDSLIMSVDANWISYFTGRNSIVTPFEPRDRIAGTAKKYGVNYIVVGGADLKLRDLDLEWLGQRYRQVYSSGGYYVFQV